MTAFELSVAIFVNVGVVIGPKVLVANGVVPPCFDTFRVAYAVESGDIDVVVFVKIVDFGVVVAFVGVRRVALVIGFDVSIVVCDV